jgi:hypothetical protein
VQGVRYQVSIPYAGIARISPLSMPGFRSAVITPPAGDSVDAKNNVGPMLQFESLVANDTSIAVVKLANRATPHYGTMYDPPGPTAPINARLVVSKYLLALGVDSGGTLKLTNRLAPLTGRLELYDAETTSSTHEGAGNRASVEVERKMTGAVSQWRVAITASDAKRPVDAYLLSCGEDGQSCYVSVQQPFKDGSVKLAVDNPKGVWRLVFRGRDRGEAPISYQIHESLLTAAVAPLETEDRQYGSGKSWTTRLPADTQAKYVAFRINEGGKSLRIAMTPLRAGAP